MFSLEGKPLWLSSYEDMHIFCAPITGYFTLPCLECWNFTSCFHGLRSPIGLKMSIIPHRHALYRWSKIKSRFKVIKTCVLIIFLWMECRLSSLDRTIPDSYSYTYIYIYVAIYIYMFVVPFAYHDVVYHSFIQFNIIFDVTKWWHYSTVCYAT